MVPSVLTWQELFLLNIIKEPAPIATVTKEYKARAIETPVMGDISHETVRRIMMKLVSIKAIDANHARTEYGQRILNEIADKYGADASEWPSQLEYA